MGPLASVWWPSNFAGPPAPNPQPLRPVRPGLPRRAGAEDAGQGFWASSIGKKAVMAVTGLLVLL